MHKAAGMNSIRPDSFLQVFLNADLCFLLSWDIFVKLLLVEYSEAILDHAASMQIGADASL